MGTGGLFGRAAQQDRIDQLLADARAGTSGSLVLIGEPGMGKTRLLAYGSTEAESSGMQILRAQGIEAESELAFGGLLELVRPILDVLPSIPGPQADALAGALALGPATVSDRFTVYAGVLSVLAAAAERKPLLVLLDDVHWLDRESQEALLFATRRLHADRVALILALREGHTDPFTPAGVPSLRLSGLAHAAAAALLAQTRGAALPLELVEQLQEMTKGNPLALKEASALLSEGQVRGIEPLDHPLRIGQDLTMAFMRRVAALPDANKAVLLVVAASETGEMSEIMTAAKTLGLDVSALGPAEDAGLVTLDAGGVRFSHPLLRSAIYHAASGQQRRAAHAALAQALSAPGDAHRRAWHRAIASVAPDETVAAELEAAASEAAGRGAPAVAAATYERAARLSPAAEDRARRLFRAATESRLMGSDEHIFALLDEALALTGDAELRGYIQALRGVEMIWYRPGDEAARILGDEAARVERSDPGRAAMLFAQTANSYTLTGDLRTAAELTHKAFGLVPQDDALAAGLAATRHGESLVILGEAERAEGFLAQGRAMIERIDVPLLLGMDLGHGFMWAEDFQTAGRFFDRNIAEARSSGALGALPYALAMHSELDFRRGRWSKAYADASESVPLAEQTNAPVLAPYGLVCLARLEAGQGREVDCREHVERALAIADRLGIAGVPGYAHAALGLLELGLGNLEAAVVQLERVRESCTRYGIGEPTVAQSEADLVEAHFRVGRIAEAKDALDRFQRRAQATGRIWSLATSARCRGLMADVAVFEDDFREALSFHDRLPMPFERARTELCLGERRRRSGDKAGAVDVLRSAVGTFEQLGAAPWVDHARRELRACGVSRKVRSSPIGSLTPQELQVALMVADGATNREAGASLFLSPKTVEFHLGNVYGKLSLRSRAELARFVAHGGLATAGPMPPLT